MKCWLAKFALISLVLVSVAYAQSARELLARTEGKSPTEVANHVSASRYGQMPEIARELKQLRTHPTKESANRLRAILRAEAVTESSVSVASASEIVQAIKKEGGYRDPGVSESSNWLSRALDRLKNLFKRDSGPQAIPDLNLPLIGAVFQYFMWSVLAIAVGIFSYFAFRHFQWRRRLARKASAVLDEDEPERSIDEWLALADELESKGEFRKAVRALYLACLLRFDEVRVARFDRGQTNWEHLARIEASPTRPAELDFRAPTKAFDLVWYGHVVRGKEDVQAFRETYRMVKQLTQVVPT